MSSELLLCYKKDAPETPICVSRDEYYKDLYGKYNDYNPAIVDIFMFNRYGELIMQRRSKKKRIMPGRLHTAAGGHINWGETAELSVVHECVEELGTAPVTLPKELYGDAIKKLDPYMNRFALITLHKEWFRYDDRDDEDVIKDRMWLYFGIYNGPIICEDRSSSGFELADLDTLMKDIKENPDIYTVGLRHYLQDFEDDLRAFVKTHCLAAGKEAVVS